ncbi:MAG: hypothetical protein Q9217_004408 [Psora testacea]
MGESSEGVATMKADQSPRLLVLPKNRSSDSRICTLAHPRTSTPSRYFFDPQNGIYEFTRVAAPKAAFRSWLISSGQSQTQACQNVKESGATTKSKAGSDGIKEQVPRPVAESYIVQKAEILVATPIDPLFLILPALYDQFSAKTPSKQLFLSTGDLLEKLSENSKHLEHVLSYGPARMAMEARIKVVCDSVNAGGENMYRLKDSKLLNELVSKAKRIAVSGLPASMDDRFVRRTLEVPVIGFKREESSLSAPNPTQILTPLSEASSLDSQASIVTSTSANSAASNDTEVTIPEEVPTSNIDELRYLLRLRITLNYMISSYIPSSLSATLTHLMASAKCPVDFKPLDERLAEIAKTKAEALAARSIGDFSRKRNIYEDDDAAESRVEKKRKKDEEEKTRKLESRGVRDLKKVDTTGMKKMSDFFGKGVATKRM